MNSITCCKNISNYLPSFNTAAKAAAVTTGSFCLGGIPAAAAALTLYGSYRFTAHQRTNRIELVQQNLKKELFNRIEKSVKNELLERTAQGPVSKEKLALIKKPSEWKNLEDIRKLAIGANLEGAISAKEMGYILTVCMVKEAEERMPGALTYRGSTKAIRPEELQIALAPIQKSLKIDPAKFFDLIGNALDQDPVLIVDIDLDKLNSNQDYHHTAKLSAELYRFSLVNQQNNQLRRIFIFQPHIYEKLLQCIYGVHAEHPVFVLGTREVETFSDPVKRVVSMTGGKTLPTPNIEANEALSLFFYLHDLYHIDIDSAIGQDRIFWNAFGKHLLEIAKKSQDADMQTAFQTLGEFCLDKDFANYKDVKQNLAFLVPLIGMLEIAGKKATEDKSKPFHLIKNQNFTKIVKEEFLSEFTKFWRGKARKLPLRTDLNAKNLQSMVPYMDLLLKRQSGNFPMDLKNCIECLEADLDEGKQF